MQSNRRQKKLICIAIILTLIFTVCCLCIQLFDAFRRADAYAERYFHSVQTMCDAETDISIDLISQKETALLQLTKCLKAYYNPGTLRLALRLPPDEQSEFLQKACNGTGVSLILITDDQGRIVFSNRTNMIGDSVIENGLYSREGFEHISENDNASVVSKNDKTVSLIVNRSEDSIDVFAPYTASIPLDERVYHVIVLADYEKLSSNITEMDHSKILLSNGSNDAFVVAVNASEDDPKEFGSILYGSRNGNDYIGKSYSDIGLRKAVLTDGYTGLQRIDGKTYYCKSAVRPLFGGTISIVMANDIALMTELPSVVLPIAMMLLISLNLCFYKSSRKSKAISIRDAAVQRILAIALIGVFLIFGTSFYSQTFSRLSYAIRQTQTAHGLLGNVIEGLSSFQATAQESGDEVGISQANLMCLSIERDPNAYLSDIDPDTYREYSVTDSDGHSVSVMDELKHPLRSLSKSAGLRALCDQFDMKRVTLYNADGYIIADSSSEWYGHIERNSAETAKLFDVLDQKSEAYVSLTENEELDETIRQIAVPLNYYVCGRDGETVFLSEKEYQSYLENPVYNRQVKHSHGLLVCEQLLPDSLFRAEASTVDFAISIREIAQDCDFIITDDSEQHNILYPLAQRNKTSADIGLSDAVFAKSYYGFYHPGDQKSFICSQQFSGSHTGNLSIISVYSQSVLFRQRMRISLAVCVIACILLALFALILKRDIEKQMPNDTFPMPLNDFSPVVEFRVNLAVLIAIAIGFLITMRGRWQQSVISYIVFGSWVRDVNLFSLSLCILMAIGHFLISRALVLVEKLFGLMSARGETLARLFVSSIKYAAAIFVIFYSLYLFGLDTKSVLRSLGVFSMIVGLGAQNLVRDILAGILIVFEGSYHVGDIVQIDGFCGKVIEIALQTTKIENSEGTIMIFNNSSIENVKNLSTLSSNIFFDIRIPTRFKPDEIVGKVTSKLPEISERHKGILQGELQYNGITNIEAYNYVIRLIAHCREKDRGRLWREINLEIVNLMQELEITQPNVPRYPTDTENGISKSR